FASTDVGLYQFSHEWDTRLLWLKDQQGNTYDIFAMTFLGYTRLTVLDPTEDNIGQVIIYKNGKKLVDTTAKSGQFDDSFNYENDDREWNWSQTRSPNNYDLQISRNAGSDSFSLSVQSDWKKPKTFFRNFGSDQIGYLDLGQYGVAPYVSRTR